MCGVDIIRPEIKICGLTNLADAQLAVEHGAWALGVIFHRPSPRRCTLVEATAISSAFRREAEVVGVFVNRPLDEVVRIADATGLTMVQLHGDEGPIYAAQLARRSGLRVIKAAQIAGKADLQAIGAFHTDFHLLDAHSEDLRGGTGLTFDWQLVESRHRRVPMILSGGLTAENVGEAIATTEPFGVDVASGVEAGPGRKDPAKLAAFFAVVSEIGVPRPAPALPPTGHDSEIVA